MNQISTHNNLKIKGKMPLCVGLHGGVIAFGNALGNSIVEGMSSKSDTSTSSGKKYKVGDAYVDENGRNGFVGSVDDEGNVGTITYPLEDDRHFRQDLKKWDEESKIAWEQKITRNQVTNTKPSDRHT